MTRRKLPVVSLFAPVPSPPVHATYCPHTSIAHPQRIFPPHEPQKARALDSVERRVLLEWGLGRRGRQGGRSGVRWGTKQSVYPHFHPFGHNLLDLHASVHLSG